MGGTCSMHGNHKERKQNFSRKTFISYLLIISFNNILISSDVSQVVSSLQIY
jgi:hypothetical protein